jgi:serralysin
MKSKLLTDLQWASDDSFFPLTADEIDASFIPGHEPGNAGASAVSSAPRGMLAATMPSSPAPGPMPDTISAQASLSGFTSVPITLGGITINLLFDVAAMSAPQSFREGIEQGATLLASAITDKITVNVNIDFDATAPNGSAGARPDGVGGLSYSLLRETLINHAAAGDTTFNALPGGASIPGFDPDSSKIIPQDDVWVYSAQEKLWGLLGANDTTTDDGQAIFGPNINPNLLASVALHELTHAFGRVPAIAGDVDIQAPDVFDLFRFVSPGVRLFQSYNGLPALPAYFSVDGGVSKLADYDQFSDPSDFLSRGVQGSTDPFDAFYTSDTNQLLTALDLEQMTALGFHMSSALPVTTTDMSGSTRLDQVGLYYYLDHMNAGAESGPLLKLNGAPVYQGELTTSFGAWKPIGAEQTATGYEVAWNVPGTDLYALWNTDAKGNFLSIGGNGGTMSGTSRD